MNDTNSEFDALKKETINRYNEIAGAYNQDWRGQHDVIQLQHLERFKKMIGAPKKRILDVGCGTGKDCAYFSRAGYEIYGLDLSEGMLKIAIGNCKKQCVEVNFLKGDMRLLEFPNNYFDGIWTKAAVVHLSPDERRKVFREFNRVLKSDGFLHVWIQNFLSLKHIMRFLQSYAHYIKSSDDNLFIKLISFLKHLSSGYAYIDNRHWFYSIKPNFLKAIKEEKFIILDTNHIFSRRLSVYAKKLGKII